jgi:hypothetical protein
MIQLPDREQRFAVPHLDEGEALRLSGFAVANQAQPKHFAEL